MFFQDLTAAEKILLEPVGQRAIFTPGQTIVQEGQPGTSLFLIHRGRVQVRKQLDANKYVCLSDLGPGEVFGEMSFLGLALRSASVVAQETCELQEIPAEAFARLVQTQPAIGAKVYHRLARELAARLGRNNEELCKALLWALGRT